MMLQSRLGASYRLFFMESTQPANNSLKRTAGAGSSLPSVSTDVLLKLAVITGNEDYRLKAATPLRTMREMMGRAPAGTGHWLAALDFYVSSPKEVVIIGPRDDSATTALLRTVNSAFRPNKVLVGADDADAAAGYSLPLLESRGMIDGRPTAYVCQNYACQLPVTTPEELAAQLED